MREKKNNRKRTNEQQIKLNCYTNVPLFFIDFECVTKIIKKQTKANRREIKVKNYELERKQSPGSGHYFTVGADYAMGMGGKNERWEISSYN